MQVALSESAQHATDLAGQVQAILAANAGLKSRTQLLETFMGLLEAGRDPEQKGEQSPILQYFQCPCYASSS